MRAFPSIFDDDWSMAPKTHISLSSLEGSLPSGEYHRNIFIFYCILTESYSIERYMAKSCYNRRSPRLGMCTNSLLIYSCMPDFDRLFASRLLLLL
jgi:hypothetical protein